MTDGSLFWFLAVVTLSVSNIASMYRGYMQGKGAGWDEAIAFLEGHNNGYQECLEEFRDR